MLRLTLEKFIRLAFAIEDELKEKQIPYDLLQYIDICIGDPAPDGDVAFEYVGPKALIRDYFD